MNIKKLIPWLIIGSIIALIVFVIIFITILSSIEDEHVKRKNNEVEEKQEMPYVKVDGEVRYNLKTLKISQTPTPYRIEPGGQPRYWPENPDDVGKNADEVKHVYIMYSRNGTPINVTNRFVEKSVTGDTIWYVTDKPNDSQIIDVYYLK